MSLIADTGTTPTTRATPWWFLLLAVLAAAAVGMATANPMVFALLFILPCVLLGFGKAFRDPWFALACTVVLYPVITVARPLHNVYNLPIFTSGVRFFPELCQMMILGYLMIRASRRPQAPETRLVITGDDLPVLAYLIVAGYSFVIGWENVHPLAPLNGWYVSVTPAVFYLVIRWLRPTDAQRDRLIRTVLITYSVVALVSIADYFLRTDIGIKLAQSERPYFVPPTIAPDVYWRYYPRMQSILWEENFFAELSNLMILFAAAHLLHARARRATYGLLALATVSLLLTISRGAYMSLAIGLCVLLCQRSPNRRWVLAAIGVVAVIGAVIVLNIRETPVVVNITRRLDTISVASAQNGDLTSDRMHHWTRAIQIFSEFPSGSGLGTAGFAAHLSGVAEETVGEGTFFRILAEQGVPGILAFVYLVLSLFWILWRLLPVCGERLRPLGASLLAFHTGFVIHAMVASTYDYYFVVPVYFLFIGLFVSGAHRHLAEQRRAALPRYVELARIP